MALFDTEDASSEIEEVLVSGRKGTKTKNYTIFTKNKSALYYARIGSANTDFQSELGNWDKKL